MNTIPLNQKVSSLIQYINELTQLKQKPIYSHKNYEEVLWVDRIPLEIECLDAFRNDSDDWLYVKKPKFPTYTGSSRRYSRMGHYRFES